MRPGLVFESQSKLFNYIQSKSLFWLDYVIFCGLAVYDEFVTIGHIFKKLDGENNLSKIDKWDTSPLRFLCSCTKSIVDQMRYISSEILMEGKS